MKLPAAAVLSLAVLVARPSAAQHVTHNGGRTINNPQAIPLYWDDQWDAHHQAAGMGRGAIESFLGKLMTDGYLARLDQYEVHSGSFHSGFDANDLVESVLAAKWSVCGSSTPGPRVNSAQVYAWVSCATSWLHLTGKLPIDQNQNFVVFLPKGTIVDDGANKSCTDYGGYHFTDLGASLFTYDVIPASCANTLDDLMRMAVHEIVESATDPEPLTGYLDSSMSVTVLVNLPNPIEILKKGEVCDICESGAAATGSQTWAGQLVPPYWSEADQKCVVGSAPPTTPPPPPAQTGVTPKSVTLKGKGVQQFEAHLSGPGTGVDWSISPAVGTITPGGKYTAPVRVGAALVVNVVARSRPVIIKGKSSGFTSASAQVHLVR